ncbi:MAG TPA: hypothetical protein DIC60_06530 [Lachnospiraceae bacterium]|jgi:hypothetical protein|nr:hypothetical protein [Lachnospiraceae bacterium]
MADENDLNEAVDKDILYCKSVWSKYSHDAEQMENLFNTMLFKYVNIIEGFAEGMQVISAYEGKGIIAEALRNNVDMIIKRLEIFKDLGYKPQSLKEYYIKEGVKGCAVNAGFNEARRFFHETPQIGVLEKKEITNKIDEIEEICISVDTKKRKWDKLRPYVIWASGKDVETAMFILALIQKIN